MSTSRKVLYENKWLRTVELNNWYIASECPATKENKMVAVLPFKKYNNTNLFLARFELNPAHMIDNNHQVSIITGACETGNILYHAQQELLEEGGYHIPKQRFNYHGIVNPLKSSCIQMYLYSVEIFDNDKQYECKGDGSLNESKEYSRWVSHPTMINAKDPYIHSIMLRMKY